MSDTTQVEVRLEPIDDDNASMVVTGDVEIIAALMLLVVSVLNEDDEDCGDPECPVHGDGASDESDIAETV